MANSPAHSTESGLFTALLEAFASLPGFEVREAKEHVRLDEAEADLLVMANVKGQPVRILIEAKASGTRCAGGRLVARAAGGRLACV